VCGNPVHVAVLTKGVKKSNRVVFTRLTSTVCLLLKKVAREISISF